MKFNLEINAEPQLMKIDVIKDKKNVGSGTSIEGVKRCFCMDIQRSKRDSTKANTT
jgi:hypothetical protein